MTLRHWISMLACALALGMTGAAVAADAPLRVMTFNVRVPVDTGMNAWSNRRDLMVQVIRAAHPDVLGTQELTQEQGEYLAAHLPGYAWFGQGREGGTKGEHMGVFYRTDRLKVLRSGDFWLSDTPDGARQQDLGPAVSAHGDLGAFSSARRGWHVRLLQYAFSVPAAGCAPAHAERERDPAADRQAAAAERA